MLEESRPTCYGNVLSEVIVLDDYRPVEMQVAVSVLVLVWTRMQFARKDGHDKTAA